GTKTGFVGKYDSNDLADVFHGGKLNRVVRPDEGNQAAFVQTEARSHEHFHENHWPDDGRSHVELSNMGFNAMFGVETRNACQFIPHAGARRINKMTNAGFGSDIRNRNAITNFV